ncbi:hypothetical protein L208DRAFT_440677 [Tricholoma matsutake]|nr:hypothetical protein L208DRAFT_440677 [Tricholoma matsutake 945]
MRKTDEETSKLGNAVASRLEILSEHLLDFQATIDTMGQGELTSVFSRVHIDDQHAGFDPTQNSVTELGGDASCRPYIKPAYRWLLANLHNPYCSKNTRNEISRKTGSDSRVILKQNLGYSRRTSCGHRRTVTNFERLLTCFKIQSQASGLIANERSFVMILVYTAYVKMHYNRHM